jgi:glycosyltransferase involved in cell wall biosynthesis
MRDFKTLALLHMADHVIFQSNYQKDMFSEYGFKGSSWSVIHNGAARDYSPAESPPPLATPLRVLSCAIGGRQSKLHALMSTFSECEGVDMHYAGKWPDDVHQGKVRLHGVLPASELAALLKTMHYFFHPGVRDICPNVVCEALASGVPVIYNPKPGGTIELAAPAGLALHEDDIEATVREARLHYEVLARKARATSEYYTIHRAMKDYMTIIQNCVD